MGVVRSIGPVLLLLFGLPIGTGQENAVPTFVIERPTVIAFSPPMTDADLEKDPDMNEVLSDFQLYASQAKPRLETAGIDFEVASATEFKVKNGGAIRDFKTGKVGVGYYFVAPGKEPHVEQGVMTDLDILDVARRQFQLPIPGRR
jgi:hypothetical protein